MECEGKALAADRCLIIAGVNAAVKSLRVILFVRGLVLSGIHLNVLAFWQDVEDRLV